MIILIDIVILIFITYFSISKSIKSNSLTEISKLISMIVGILGAIFLYPSLLQNLILNLSSSLFDINKNQMDFNFFYMISFFIQFFIIYFIASIFASYIKSFAHLKPNSINSIQCITVQKSTCYKLHKNPGILPNWELVLVLR